MRTRDYINNKKISNNKKIEKLKKKSKLFDFISFGGAVLGFSLAGCLLLYSIVPSVVCLGLGACFLSSNIKNRKVTDSKVREINNQNNFLDKTLESNIDASLEKNKQRKGLLKQYSGELKDEEDNVNKSNIRDYIIAGALGVLAGVGFMFGGFTCLFSPLVAGLKFIANSATSHDIDECEKVKSKANNVKNELDIIDNASNNVSGRRPSRARALTSKRENERHYSKADIEAVDDYVESLANEGSISNGNSKMIVKK